MTDIWRSFVAQRCLWELDMGVVFHAPEVEQERNFHDLMKDFEDEIQGYLGNRQIAKALMSLDLKKGSENLMDNLYKCYEQLVSIKLLPLQELELLNTWILDLKSLLPFKSNT